MCMLHTETNAPGDDTLAIYKLNSLQSILIQCLCTTMGIEMIQNKGADISKEINIITGKKLYSMTVATDIKIYNKQ